MMFLKGIGPHPLLLLIIVTFSYHFGEGFFVGSSAGSRYSSSLGRQQQQQQQQHSSPPTSLLPTSSILQRQGGSQQQEKNNQQQCHHRLQATTSSSSSSSQQKTQIVRNKFHDYNKPIVLIGRSSNNNNNELHRLAESFLVDNGVIESNDDDKIGEYIISGINNKNKDELIQSIQSGTYKWPQFVVLDFAKNKDDDDATTGAYSDIAKSLYDDMDMLSIYVNVEGSSSSNEKEESIFEKYSDYELCIKNSSDDDNDIDSDENLKLPWEHVTWELTRLLARARLVPAVPGSKEPSSNTAYLTMGDHTFFLSLSFPTIQEVQPYVEQMCQDVDAMEYRTDLLKCRNSKFDLLYGMQLLRYYCRNYVVRVPALPNVGSLPVLEDVMPIVYTVRTQHQAGTYPDDTDEDISKMFDMLQWGLRAGVEVLDVESAWNEELTNNLLSMAEERYSSQILGSHHVVGKEISTEEAVELFQQCALNGRAHGAKVVLSIESSDKDRMAHEAATIASSLAQRDGQPVIPNISLILGDVGSFSRVVNLPFTPVTHESLPFKAAPGQMTANEIMAARILSQIMDKRKFVILGHNIAYSVSPQMQGAAFAATRLPHQYGRADVETVEEFVESDFFKSPDFGGCSITIPHKQAIIPYVDVMSDSAKIIGSVNTLIVKDEVDLESDEMKRVLYGDNTDWKGIYNPLERKLGGALDAEDESNNGICLILGGGGTARAAAYAASKLGLKRVYYNRTPSKAEELADTFGGTVISSLEQEGSQTLGEVLSKSDGGAVKVVISTLPAGAEFVLPNWFLEQEAEKPIIFDVNYKPYYTELLRQAEREGCQVVRGSEMLWEQGVGQFEAWTHRTAPYGVMKAVVLENCLPTTPPEEGPDAFQ